MIRKLHWFNEPLEWKIIDTDSISMFVTPHTDYWRQTHYGFTVDDGPFYYADLGGEFEMKVNITGEYKNRFDQMGLMVRKNENTWIKAGVEYVNDKINISAVVTHTKSDWSMVELSHKPESLWLKVVRRLDAVKLYYSFDGENYILFRLAYFPNNTPVMAGITAASPDGNGFNAIFKAFEINNLPDTTREEWLKRN